MHRLIVATVLLASACKSDHRKLPDHDKPPPATRPSAISDSDIQILDQLVAALESINHEIKGEHDCAKAAAAIRATASKAAPVFAALPKLEQRTRADKDVEAWAFAHYGQTIKPLMEGITMHECASDAAYKAALAQLQ